MLAGLEKIRDSDPRGMIQYPAFQNSSNPRRKTRATEGAMKEGADHCFQHQVTTFPFRGGEMGELIREFDWSKTSLGPIAEWPVHLKATVGLMLPARAQIVLFWGPEFVALYNDAYAPTIGDKHPKALGHPARVNWAELWDDLEPLLQQVLLTGETVFAKDRMFYIERHGYPENVYFNISYSPVHDENGRVDGVLCIVDETTRRIVAERALVKTEERLSNALQAAGLIGTFDTDLRSGMVYSDARFANMFSVDPQKAESGLPLADYLAGIHPDDVKLVSDGIEQAITTGEKCILEYRVQSKEGTVRWLEVHGQCRYDESGSPWRIPGAAVDITDRKRAELAIAHFAAIVESSDDAIISKDINGVITSWNTGAQRLFGYRADETIGNSITMLIPDDRKNEEPAILARLRRGDQVEHFETVRRRKDGGLIDLSLTISPIRDTHGKIVGASKIARDITDRKAHERLQNTLLSEMKHRLQNNLSTVLAIARQSFRGHEAESEDFRKFEARLLALASGHDLIARKSWNSAELGDVVAQLLNVHGRQRFEIDGPDVRLSPKSALALTLALHELATNAAKYGALSIPTGKVTIAWDVEQKAIPSLAFRWQERYGPAVSQPSRKGFGSQLIERVLAFELGGQVHIAYPPEGVVCEIIAPLSAEWEKEVKGSPPAQN
ncbi:PAS domain S-box protein [Nitrobacter sp. 62-13]|uniref:PAS domain-containing sensor histidine kinase n=1 Tax=Nitrobacter sp. 62-13 TaxID=1895797 RepID=UPI000B33F1C8|nr:PAS domain S-box protein [Nitrobacter sp. 62-13]